VRAIARPRETLHLSQTQARRESNGRGDTPSADPAEKSDLLCHSDWRASHEGGSRGFFAGQFGRMADGYRQTSDRTKGRTS
jgi:hypothetical protein